MKEKTAEPKPDVISGRNPVSEAIRSGRPIDKLMVARGEKSGAVVGIIAKAVERGIPVKEVDRLTRKLEAKVYKATGVVLTGVGLYSYNTGDSEAARIQNDVTEKVLAHDWAVQLHGFYVDTETKEMTFDVVMSFDIQPREGLQIIYAEMREAYPDYKITITPDVDVSVTE